MKWCESNTGCPADRWRRSVRFAFAARSLTEHVGPLLLPGKRQQVASVKGDQGRPHVWGKRARVSWKRNGQFSSDGKHSENQKEKRNAVLGIDCSLPPSFCLAKERHIGQKLSRLWVYSVILQQLKISCAKKCQGKSGNPGSSIYFICPDRRVRSEFICKYNRLLDGGSGVI